MSSEDPYIAIMASLREYEDLPPSETRDPDHSMFFAMVHDSEWTDPTTLPGVALLFGDAAPIIGEYSAAIGDMLRRDANRLAAASDVGEVIQDLTAWRALLEGLEIKQWTERGKWSDAYATIALNTVKRAIAAAEAIRLAAKRPRRRGRPRRVAPHLTVVKVA